nr:hypothetical protein CFP56_09933 [Quercus suber]
MHPLPRPVFSNHEASADVPSKLTVSPTPPIQQRPVRNLMEIEQARQDRRANIEQRCLQLEPPLSSNVLQHIEAFQAAMQITTPMTDKQWDLLLPRILARREAAELFVHQKAEQFAALQSVIPLTAHNDASLKAAREVYEQAQKPLRLRLGEYADDIVIGQWHGGRGLDQHNAPGFAIQTLQHVYKRYIEDKQAGRLELDPTSQAQSSALDVPPEEPFLSLDNMKWVYEHKVKPLTDQHCRDLFICAGCSGTEKANKWFAFEGLIQHYGAKHTSAFSHGNIVVRWETAEWPGEPGETPFSTDQSAFVKPERKIAGSKSHTNTLRIQQPASDGQVQVSTRRPVYIKQEPLASGRTALSDRQNQQHPAVVFNEHSQHTNGRVLHQEYLPPVPSPQRLLPQPQPEPEHFDENLFVDVASSTWHRLGDVEKILPCIRTKTAIDHAILQHLRRSSPQPHGHPPFKLEKLIRALYVHDNMAPIKEAKGLACKICVASQPREAANSQSYYVRTRDVKLYSFAALVNHFQITHTYDGQRTLDWSANLIEVPELPMITELLRAPGMTYTKLVLLSASFPTAFPDPLPEIGASSHIVTDKPQASSLASRVLDGTKKKRKTQALLHSEATDSTPDGNEYDPRRPSIITRREHRLDPARFDTDLARKSPDSSPESRSPSVGDPTSPPPAPLPQQLDLGAILAALTNDVPQARTYYR